MKYVPKFMIYIIIYSIIMYRFTLEWHPLACASQMLEQTGTTCNILFLWNSGVRFLVVLTKR
jgi:hypothetical protein